MNTLIGLEVFGSSARCKMREHAFVQSTNMLQAIFAYSGCRKRPDDGLVAGQDLEQISDLPRRNYRQARSAIVFELDQTFRREHFQRLAQWRSRNTELKAE